MMLMRRRMGLFFTLFMLATGVIGMRAASSAAVDGLPRIEKTSLVWWRLPAGRSVWIYARGGYCKGEPPPTIHDVRIREHRLPGRSKLAAVVTVFLEYPSPIEVPSGARGSGEPPAEPIPVCAGVEHALYKRISLDHLISEVVLFDGSHSPPRRIPERP